MRSSWLADIADACRTIVAVVAMAEALGHLRRQRAARGPATPDPMADHPGPGPPAP